MVVHHGVSLAQPVGRPGRERHPTVVNTHEPAAAGGVEREPDFFDRIGTPGGSTVRQEDELVRLSNRLPGPIGGLLVRQIDNQIIFAFDDIQPIHDGRVVKLQVREPVSEIAGCEKQAFARTCEGGAQAVKKCARNLAMSGCNDGDGARCRDTGAAGHAGGGVGEPLRQAAQQPIVDFRHPTRDLLERGAIKFEHDQSRTATTVAVRSPPAKKAISPIG